MNNHPEPGTRGRAPPATDQPLTLHNLNNGRQPGPAVTLNRLIIVGIMAKKIGPAMDGSIDIALNEPEPLPSTLTQFEAAIVRNYLAGNSGSVVKLVKFIELQGFTYDEAIATAREIARKLTQQIQERKTTGPVTTISKQD